MSENLSMSHIHDQTSVSPADLAIPGEGRLVLDVRKPSARSASGLMIPGSVWRHPFAAADWAEEVKGQLVTVYCVHGHEVSRAVCGYLRDCGVTASILEGGFEAWRQAGLATCPLEPSNA